MLRVAVVGATGYAGEELVKILAGHPEIELTSLSAIVDAPAKFSALFPYFRGKVDLICKTLNTSEVGKVSDLVFLALPHRVSMEIAPEFLKMGKKVIDLSADYRLHDIEVYKKWYGTAHRDAGNIKKAVYGLPEFYRKKIKDANLIANPGCYPTSILLALLPVAGEDTGQIEFVIADSKSGVTGAGRKADVSLSFGEVNGNMKAYKVNAHQHSPEINQELSLISGRKAEVFFTPHLIPIQRGILSTVYIKFKTNITENKILDMYAGFYKNEPFVRIYEKGLLPQLKDVVMTNFCDIGVKVDEEKRLLIAVSVIDNLVKGAAGQAVQNMNIMCGFDEKAGLN